MAFKEKINIFWFRRDLRIEDNKALFYALKSGHPVLTVFIFDLNILNKLDKDDKRISAIYQLLYDLNLALIKKGTSLHFLIGSPIEAFTKLISEYSINTVYSNKDYEPYAIHRDKKIHDFLKHNGVKFQLYKDQVIFEENEILNTEDMPYTVFTPYMKKWKKQLNKEVLTNYNSTAYFQNFYQKKDHKIPSINETGFNKFYVVLPDNKINIKVIKNYHKYRDLPVIEGTSRLSIHLRFGTISIRKLVNIALTHNEKFLNELIWREFYMMILFHFPYVTEEPFKKQFSFIEWDNNEIFFERWKNGETGIPLVDAGMRQLNKTGFMHNRLRMITASFLTKNLLIDWRWGEAYFAKKLLDFELSSNNGGWQWVAGTGTDAVPYFRIFNPVTQALKYDPGNEYIKKWIPEINTSAYIKPLVDLKISREYALSKYKSAIFSFKS